MGEVVGESTRPDPVDADPSARLEEVLGLLDDLADVTRLSDGLFHGIEQVTGLRVSEIQLLRTVSHGAVDVRDIARRIGQTDEAATATVEGLVERGLVRRDREAEPAEVLRLTETGAAVLEQTEGVQVRLLDTLVGEVGTEGARAFRTTLRGISDVLRAVAGHAGMSEPEGS